MDDVVTVMAPPTIREVIGALDGEFRPAGSVGFSRQRVAYAAMKRPDLIEREWQDGCARCTYYRLTPLGLAVQAGGTHG